MSITNSKSKVISATTSSFKMDGLKIANIESDNSMVYMEQSNFISSDVQMENITISKATSSVFISFESNITIDQIEISNFDVSFMISSQDEITIRRLKARNFITKNNT